MLTTHTHQLAKKSRLLPSFPLMLVPYSSPQRIGDRLRATRDGRMPGAALAERVPLLLESSPLHFQVQEPGLSPGGSWNESRPQPVPALPPKLRVHLLLPKARAMSQKRTVFCMFQVSPGYPALWAESGWKSFLVVLSRSTLYSSG